MLALNNHQTNYDISCDHQGFPLWGSVTGLFNVQWHKAETGVLCSVVHVVAFIPQKNYKAVDWMSVSWTDQQLRGHSPLPVYATDSGDSFWSSQSVFTKHFITGKMHILYWTFFHEPNISRSRFGAISTLLSFNIYAFSLCTKEQLWLYLQVKYKLI